MRPPASCSVAAGSARAASTTPASGRSMSVRIVGPVGIGCVTLIENLASLQLVVAVLRAGLAEADAAAHRFADRVFGGLDVLRGGEHLVLLLLRDHHDAVGVAAHQVARAHAHVADVHRDLRRLDLHAVLAGAHPGIAAEDGVAQLQAQGDVAVDAVDDRAGDALAVRHLGQDVAPHGDVVASAVVEHDHAARRHVVDVVAHRAGRRAGWAVLESPGAAGHAELG